MAEEAAGNDRGDRPTQKAWVKVVGGDRGDRIPQVALLEAQDSGD